MGSEEEQLATSSHSVSVTIKCEPFVNEEPEWDERDAGEAVASADLFEDDEVNKDMAFSPEELQEQNKKRSVQIFSVDLKLEPKGKLRQLKKIKQEASDGGSEGNCNSDVPLSNGDMLVKEENYPFKLEPPNEVKREPEYLYACSWELPCSMSLEQQFQLRSCFVRLERIPLGYLLTNNTGPGTYGFHDKHMQTKPQPHSYKPIKTQTVCISFSCNFCGKRFTKKNDFTRHIRIHTGEKPYNCDVCKKLFTDRSGLTRHIRIHKGEAQHCCDVCHKEFVQKSDFDKHRLSHMGEKPHACKICEKQFAKHSDLARHIRVHTGEKPYGCDVCAKQFADRSILTRHKRVHSGVKSFSCSTCHKRFVQKSHLNRHVKIHTGVKPFICDVCNYGFTQKETLIGHMRIHMGQRPYNCHVCPKKFAAKSTLTNHLKAHDGAKPSGFHTGAQKTETTCPYTDSGSSLLKVSLVKKGNSKIK